MTGDFERREPERRTRLVAPLVVLTWVGLFTGALLQGAEADAIVFAALFMAACIVLDQSGDQP